MKQAILGTLACLCLAGAAWAQEPTLTWNFTGFNGNATVAWAVKTPAAAGKLPEIMLAQDNRPPDKFPQLQVATLEVDCTKRTVRPIVLDVYNSQFVKTESRASKNGHSPFMGALEYSLNDFCRAQSRATKQATPADALKWISSYHPAAVVDPVPPTGANLAFELAGRGTDMQRIHSWLETTSMAKTGASARAWVFEAWQGGWQPGSNNFTPATWRLYEFDCQTTIRQREVWFQQLDPKLAQSSKKSGGGDFRVTADPTLKQIGLRVCVNRAMLFSETFSGSDKELVASLYGGAAQVGVAAKPAAKVSVTLVDLGPTIRMTMDDNGYKYTGVFTRDYPTSSTYKGEFWSDAKEATKIKDTISVIGIRNGLLEIDSVYRNGPYGIPVTNGKTSGKGVLYSERDNDKWTWSLVEPTVIGLKTAPASIPAAPTRVPNPAPAPGPTALKPAGPTPLPAPVTPAPAAAAPKTTASVMSVLYDGATWRLLASDATHAIAWADANAPTGQPPRLHIMWTYAMDQSFPGSSRPARSYYWTVDLDCAGEKFQLKEERYLNQAGIEVGANPAQTYWRAAAQLKEAEPLLKQKCSGAASTGDTFFGTARSTHGWLKGRLPS
ncbi:MAG: hypothetical protein QM773_00995 [Hyphomonadaceae bacterium]